MRVLVECFGWTLDLTINRDTPTLVAESVPDQTTHLGGSFDQAPPPDGEYVYEDRFGLRGRR